MSSSLEEISQQLNRIEETLKGINHFYKDILNVEEASSYCGLKTSYIYKLCSERKIPHYKNSGKMLRFKKDELNSWMLRNKVKTITDIDDEANTYMNRI